MSFTNLKMKFKSRDLSAEASLVNFSFILIAIRLQRSNIKPSSESAPSSSSSSENTLSNNSRNFSVSLFITSSLNLQE